MAELEATRDKLAEELADITVDPGSIPPPSAQGDFRTSKLICPSVQEIIPKFSKTDLPCSKPDRPSSAPSSHSRPAALSLPATRTTTATAATTACQRGSGNNDGGAAGALYSRLQWLC
eukprot:4820230-Amphidinium_carterae.1